MEQANIDKIRVRWGLGLRKRCRGNDHVSLGAIPAEFRTTVLDGGVGGGGGETGKV